MSEGGPRGEGATTQGPLSGLTVLEFTHFLAGPYAGVTLADLGAQVIKVEDVSHPDEAREVGPYFAGGQSLYFLALNWGKRSFAVNLSDPRGRDLVLRLAVTADAVLDNYRPGVMAKLGLNHKALELVNPRIVTCSITGFGETGPYATRPAYDYTIQALSGVMSLTGEPGTAPVKAGVSYVDHNGGLAAGLAICAAIIERGRTGVGRHIDIGLLDVQISMLTYLAAWQLNAGVEPGRTANSAHPSLVPAQNFSTREGHIAVFVGNDSTWRRLAAVMQEPRLESPEYATNAQRLTHREEIVTVVQSVLARRDAQEWVQILNDAGVPCSRVNTVSGALGNEQVRARGLVRWSDGAGSGPYRHAAGPLPSLGVAGGNGAPMFGADTADLLRELGCTAEIIAELGANGTVVLGAGDAGLSKSAS